MGILNVTPDSFSDGGKYLVPSEAHKQALRIAEEGADLLDVGAESTRPGAVPLDQKEEWERLHPVLKLLVPEIKIPISIDTRHAEVARRALDFGVEIINDVSAGEDPAMFPLIAESRCGYVLMHHRGDPANMMSYANYADLLGEVKKELFASRERALNQGIDPANLCLDPGFGFAKTTEQNWELLDRLNEIAVWGHPLVVGISRKRMLRERYGSDPQALLTGGLHASSLALAKGANILRTHDVAATRRHLQTLQKAPISLD